MLPELHIIDEDDVGYTQHLLNTLCARGVLTPRLVRRVVVSRTRVEDGEEIELMRLPAPLALGGTLVLNARLRPRVDECSVVALYYAGDRELKSAFALVSRLAYIDAVVAEAVVVSRCEDVQSSGHNFYLRDVETYSSLLSAREVAIKFSTCSADNVYVEAMLYI